MQTSVQLIDQEDPALVLHKVKGGKKLQNSTGAVGLLVHGELETTLTQRVLGRDIPADHFRRLVGINGQTDRRAPA